MSESEIARLGFGVFELDLQTGELRKGGVLLSLPPQPFKILALLTSHPGQLVTREEIQQQIWGSDTFVDFEQGLNVAIRKIRDVLGDDPETPRYIQTLPRRGYRFIAPVETAKLGLRPASTPPDVSPQVTTGGVTRRAIAAVVEGVVEAHRARLRWRRLAGLGIATAGLAVGLAMLVGLNVGGLRERFLSVVGARHGVPLPKIESIAVLPLENLSHDPEQEYFADGMTDELITSLGKINALRVISRQSMMRYKGSKKPLPEIARELNVDALVEGTVLRSGNRVRITANLLYAPTDRHLWAETYERDLRDVLALQGEVARAIAREVQVKLTAQEQARFVRARPVNPEAHELYLKGNDWLRRGDPKKALEYFQQAIDKDPNFARAYLGIAWAYGVLGRDVQLPGVEAYAKEKAYSRKALELDDSLEEAHVVLAYGLWYGDWDWSGSEREIKRALEINPNSASARGIYNGYLTFVNRPEESIAQARRALEINPLAAEAYLRMGGAYYFGRRYDEALAQFEKAKSLEEDPREVPWHLGGAYAGKGMYKEAIQQFLQMRDTPLKLGYLGNAYARAGNKAEARKIVQELADKSAREHVGNYELGLVYAGLGEKDKAFQSLEEAYLVHDGWLSHMKVDPPLDPLRSDPRFQDLLRRMNFPP